MHSRRMNLSSLVITTVYLCSDCTDSAATFSPYGSLFCCAQAPSHCLQPMHIVASYSRALLMAIAPRCSQAGLPFQWNKVRGKRTLGRNRLGNRTEHIWRAADQGKKTGSGGVIIRTRAGCSIWQSEQGRRLPAGNETAWVMFRPPT